MIATSGSRPQGGTLTFAAIDFETADHGPDSACAVGLVRVSGATIVKRKYYLIRPTRSSLLHARARHHLGTCSTAAHF
jgi:DNA polymerase III epsilon subunit-like protein